MSKKRKTASQKLLDEYTKILEQFRVPGSDKPVGREELQRCLLAVYRAHAGEEEDKKRVLH